MDTGDWVLAGACSQGGRPYMVRCVEIATVSEAKMLQTLKFADARYRQN